MSGQRMDLVLRLVVIAGAYLLGGCMPGYWLVRWRAGTDVRSQGSGRTGATNAGRVLGRGGYAVVLAIDLAKGALAVWVAGALELGPTWAGAAALAVVVGHVWPALLGFRGGRGLGPLAGAWLVLAPWALLASAALTAVVLGVTRRSALAAAVGLCVLPFAVYRESDGAKWTCIAAAVCAVVVLVAHRDYFLPRASRDAAVPR